MDSYERRTLIAAFLFVVLLAALPLAFGAPSESYEPLPPTVLTDYRTSVATPLDGADSLSWIAPLVVAGPNRTLIPTNGNPTLYCRVDLSAAAATCVVYCGLWQKVGATYYFLGVSGKTTATAGAGTRATGRYVADSLLAFDTGAATHVELRKADPSGTETVSLLPWVGGSAPRGAGSD